MSSHAATERKITAAFDGGRISSDGGVMLLALAERRMGIADKPRPMSPMDPQMAGLS